MVVVMFWDMMGARVRRCVDDGGRDLPGDLLAAALPDHPQTISERVGVMFGTVGEGRTIVCGCYWAMSGGCVVNQIDHGWGAGHAWRTGSALLMLRALSKASNS
jgi:hypothetical protein